MRSDAKASTAGSNRRPATGLGAICRGALATRGASPAAKGSGAPSTGGRLLAPALLLTALLTLTLGAGSAHAANGVLDFYGGNGVLGGQFGAANAGPGGVAVNQAGSGGASAGDFYVVDRGNRRVQHFEADGTWVRAFGKNVEGAGVDVCEVAANCVQATNNAEAGALNVPQGIAIDQDTGNLYVTDQTNRRVSVFSAEGEFQGAFGWGVDTGAAELEFCTTASGCQAAAAAGAGAGNFGAQIGYPAVAPAGSPHAGDLYVANKTNRRVDHFEPEIVAGEVTGVDFVKAWGWGVDDGASEFQQCTTVSGCVTANTSSPTTNPGQFSANQPQALAVDSNGNLYTVESAGNNRAQKFDSSGNPAAFSATELSGSPGPQDVVVDATTDRLYAIKDVGGERRVLELNAAGALLATHASGTTITSANGLAHIGGSADFYMTTNQSAAFRGVFLLATKVPPTASVEAPDPLTAHTATIKGKVNPQGFQTSYRFEFSRDGGSSWENHPASDANLGSGEADVEVSQEVTGLVGGNSYRYRIVATKPFGAGSVTTGAQIFSAPAAAPTVPETFTSAVTTNTAVLEASINPQNQATSYRFEWGTADCASNPCTTIPVPDAGIGSGDQPVGVAKEIAGLQPGTTYHFRVVATNATGTTEGPDTTFNTYAPFVPKTDCPNQAHRYGPGANLPDCRAYEMVSPVDKNGGDIAGICNINCARTAFNMSALDGGKITYSSATAFGDAIAGPWSSQYIATRGSDGWSSTGISPPRRAGLNEFLSAYDDQEVMFKDFTDDLSSAWVYDSSLEPLTSNALEDSTNLFRRDNTTGSYHALTIKEPVTPPILKGTQPQMQGHSKDGTHAFFIAERPLTPDAAAGTNYQLYGFSGGKLRLVSVLPDGTPDPNRSWAGTLNTGVVGATHGVHSLDNAISEDGSRVFWSSSTSPGGGTGNIYLRQNPAEEQSALDPGDECTEPAKACTTHIDFGQFWSAAPDGSKLLYSSSGSLRVFDVDAETTTVVAGGVNGVLGSDDDLSRIYFVSTEDLAPGATAGQRNLYLDHEGAKTFIATLSALDTGGGASTLSEYNVGSQRPLHNSSRVTPDGRHLAFQSNRSLTGNDNIASNNGEPAVEVYMYDAEAEELTCASCNPSGARPVARPLQRPFQVGDIWPWSDGGGTQRVWTASWLTTAENSLHTPRTLSEDGSRIFFNSFNSLAPGDTNGVQDVYQWERQGSGTCQRAGGCISLISTGQSAEKSEFVDASANGDEVFFETNSSIHPDDPGLIDIYVARVGGGYPLPPTPIPCIGDACQNVPPAPQDQTPASAGFKGAGNPRAQRNCAAPARRAANLNRRAKRLRNQASRSSAPKRSRQLRKRSARLNKRAKQLRRNAARCRQANRRAQR